MTKWLDVNLPDGTQITSFMNTDVPDAYMLLHFKQYKARLDGLYTIKDNMIYGLYLQTDSSSDYLLYTNQYFLDLPTPQSLVWNLTLIPFSGYYYITLWNNTNRYLSAYTTGSSVSLWAISNPADLTNTNLMFYIQLFDANVWKIRNVGANKYLDGQTCFSNTASSTTPCAPGTQPNLNTADAYSFWIYTPYYEGDLEY